MIVSLDFILRAVWHLESIKTLKKLSSLEHTLRSTDSVAWQKLMTTYPSVYVLRGSYVYSAVVFSVTI